MGMANLGGVVFRINPDQISWNWQIYTNVIETIGGRVVQIYGAQLSDITVSGSFGEARVPGQGGDDSPGRGWRMADAFAQQIHDLMAASAPIPGVKGAYIPPKPIRFTYFTSGDALAQGLHDYDFMVFIRSLQDATGSGAVEHRTGKFDYKYTLTLVVVKDNTTHLMNNSGPAQQTKDSAIQAALNRISNGIGWKLTRFNDQSLADGNKDGLGNTPAYSNYAEDLRAAILKQGGLAGITPISGATGSSTPSTSGTTSGAAPTQTGNPARQKVIAEAQKHLGQPYVAGATGPAAFDCSGFSQYVYKIALGFDLPRTTFDQILVGTTVTLEHAQPGDLIFFDETGADAPGPGGNPWGHVGIYIGGNNMYNAENPSAGVTEASIIGFSPVNRYQIQKIIKDT